ncbi:hypothetical protein CQR51_0971 [Bifidobacterium pseudolongum subsp. globosum]|uniref:hypothetical protein n=1 Tax=Bifidobacterium pseudolongum TaxID=1694 RepID=UPI000C6FCE0D|nr:hypothetical protein [Bifidobacterium pseudolongum]PKV05727.1 hypothetical protein CQR51_0971 [Bifidobacterium pseudolongum subsp. globosum]RYQ56578.1 hypothetical protein PG1565B_1039 [Bifidobacterium pseudolongum subsp. globosum]RYQ60499.1 hypothetical protein PG1546B_1039 [Bifidobacterium pseudolongum subsp. globosum]
MSDILTAALAELNELFERKQAELDPWTSEHYEYDDGYTSGLAKALAVLESRQTKETDMNEHTALATGTNHDHRTFDEFDVSKALRLPYTDDEMALIETATAQAIFDDHGLVNDETLTNTMYGYELDECGNRRMQVKILDDKHAPVVAIDVTDIVATIFNLLNGLLAGRMKNLQDSYDLLHHQGIYAGNDADTTE